MDLAGHLRLPRDLAGRVRLPKDLAGRRLLPTDLALEGRDGGGRRRGAEGWSGEFSPAMAPGASAMESRCGVAAVADAPRVSVSFFRLPVGVQLTDLIVGCISKKKKNAWAATTYRR